MKKEYQIFDFQQIINDFKIIVKDQDLDFYSWLDSITEDTTVEDMPFYKDYLSKFNLETGSGMELLENFPTFGSKGDFELLVRLLLGSEISDCEFCYDLNDALSLEITVNVGDSLYQKKLSELTETVTVSLYQVLIQELLEYEYLGEISESDKKEIDEKREQLLRAFEKQSELQSDKKNNSITKINLDDSFVYDETKVEIVISDIHSLGADLLKEGFTQEDLLAAKKTIRNYFHAATVLVFSDILCRRLPKSVKVCIRNERTDGKNVSAAFSSQMSSEDNLFFILHERFTKLFFTKHPERAWATIVHETIHAADLTMISKIKFSFDEFLKKNKNSITNPLNDGNVSAMLFVLQALYHYRTEGVALLGECLLTKQKFDSIHQCVLKFRATLEMILHRSLHWLDELDSIETIFNDEDWSIAYEVAPAIVLLVLEKRGDINDSLTSKVRNGFLTGYYAITKEEVQTILRAALSLSLSDYIHGLLLLGEQIAPVRALLKLCANIQDQYDEDNVDTFMQLLNNPETGAAFITVMQNIEGSLLQEEQIDSFFTDYCKNPQDEGMDKKVKQLYKILKCNENLENRRIAQWALTYLFDSQDLIQDDQSVIGFVDDMVVLDVALKLLRIH